MKDYVILTDSCCDLSAGMAEELELHVLPLSFVMEEKEYFNHLDYRDISAKDFYARVRGGALGTTSAINVAVFTEAMTELSNSPLSTRSLWCIMITSVQVLPLQTKNEAARAGAAGRGFAVVAQEIKSLSESSRDTALDSNKNKKEIGNAMDQLAEASGHLMEIVDEVNERISSLAASTQEIAASATMIGKVSDELKGKFEELNRMQ